MRHCYVGDVGDFYKYGLLRALLENETDDALGVVWYLTDVAEHNNDGKHDGYLKRGTAAQRDAFRRCDPELYERLSAIRNEPTLDLGMVSSGMIFPKRSAFHDVPVPAFRGRLANSAAYVERLKTREKWHGDAMRVVADARFIFTDPDNGIRFQSRAQLGRRLPSHKHSYWFEIEDYLKQGKSVVAYHHLGRQEGGHTLQITRGLATIRESGYEAYALHFRRGTGRVFFVIPAADRRDVLRERCVRFSEKWHAHATLITE